MAWFSLALCLFVAGYHWGNRYKQVENPALEAGVLLRPAVAFPPFQAVQISGLPLSPAKLHGNWHLLALATETTASDQQTLRHMARILNRLAARPKLQAAIIPVLLIASQSSEQALQRLEKARPYHPRLLAGYATEGGLDGANSTLAADNAAGLYLLDNEARIQAVFTLGKDPATIARDIGLLYDARQ